MQKIGLLSDTHGFLNERIIKFFENCDQIWHSGDIGSLEVADKLMKMKPLKAVYGNIDDYIIRKTFPLVQSFYCEDVKVLMTHIGGYPGHYEKTIKPLLEEEKPRIFVSGHSHILKIIYDKKYNLLHLNPGAAGNSGFHQMITALRFSIEGSNIENMEIFELPRKSII